jgi:hypothetical protein
MDLIESFRNNDEFQMCIKQKISEVKNLSPDNGAEAASISFRLQNLYILQTKTLDFVLENKKSDSGFRNFWGYQTWEQLVNYNLK